MQERLIMRVISMIDEMMTLLESEQSGEDNKKAYYVKRCDQRDDEAKAPTRQITGHKDLLSCRDAHIQAMRRSIPELDESVTNAVGVGLVQQAEFAAAVCRKCSRHQGLPPGDEVGATRPCEATCEQADEPGEARHESRKAHAHELPGA